MNNTTVYHFNLALLTILQCRKAGVALGNIFPALHFIFPFPLNQDAALQSVNVLNTGRAFDVRNFRGFYVL